VEAAWSAISPGTEAMIFRGAFPKDAPLDASLGTLSGRFSYPFGYGYAVVGRVVALGRGVAADWEGVRVFVFHPHQDRLTVPLAACHRIPAGISEQCALLLPPLETALTLVLDGAPLIGERVLVFGLGPVGLLTAALLARFPLARLVAVEPHAGRRGIAADWGVAATADPCDAEGWEALSSALNGADLAFELSGSMAALGLAIEAMGFDGRIVVGSWYGAAGAPLDLGSHFHRNRLRLVSSQVSTIAPMLAGRWDQARRLECAWRILATLPCERLPRRAFALEQCQQAFEALCEGPGEALQTLFRY